MNKEIVKALFDKIDSMGISCYKVSNDCNISEAALSYIKNGERQPRLLVLLMIAETYNISLADIIRDAEEKLSGNTKKDSV